MSDLTYADTMAGNDPSYELSGLEGEDDIAILEGLAGDELGARWATARQLATRAGSMMRGRQQQRRPAPAPTPTGPGYPAAMPLSQLIPSITGVPARGLRRTWLPLGSLLFAVASPLASQTLTARTQRPFRGTRLVFDFVRTGATANGLLTLSQVVCGQDNQPAAQGAAPLAAFAPTAFDVAIDLDPIGPGVDFTCVINTTVVPGAADRIDVAGVLFGFQVK